MGSWFSRQDTPSNNRKRSNGQFQSSFSPEHQIKRQRLNPNTSFSAQNLNTATTLTQSQPRSAQPVTNNSNLNHDPSQTPTPNPHQSSDIMQPPIRTIPSDRSQFSRLTGNAIVPVTTYTQDGINAPNEAHGLVPQPSFAHGSKFQVPMVGSDRLYRSASISSSNQVRLTALDNRLGPHDSNRFTYAAQSEKHLPMPSFSPPMTSVRHPSRTNSLQRRLSVLSQQGNQSIGLDANVPSRLPHVDQTVPAMNVQVQPRPLPNTSSANDPVITQVRHVVTQVAFNTQIPSARESIDMENSRVNIFVQTSIRDDATQKVTVNGNEIGKTAVDMKEALDDRKDVAQAKKQCKQENLIEKDEKKIESNEIPMCGNNRSRESRGVEQDDSPSDIRGERANDAPVRKEFLIRAVRDDDGKLSLETGDRPLYSKGFLENLGKTAFVPIPKLENGRAVTHDGQMNFLKPEYARKLWKRKMDFPLSEKVIPDSNWNVQLGLPKQEIVGAFGIKERKKVDLRGKTYLAPLTTVGNLPFRRVCKRLGVDVTCGEMAMAANLLKGQKSEWALLRRDEREDLFGVQIAGQNVSLLTRAAEMIGKECKVDFVELNSGCPIDLLFNKGGGCALMSRRPKLRRIVWSVSKVLPVPLGVKVRTGISEKKRNADIVISDVSSMGASWITVHGRSRKQRYSKDADWQYLRNICAPAAKRAGIPLLGNGDVYHWRDAVRYYPGGEDQDAGFTSVMVARGALIKPWVFTEIREQRDWDIRSGERLELYREFVRYGLEHWGADEKGVEITRRFLLEWLSFLYRYVPLGLIETPDFIVRMCHRAPFFRGRDELETLLGSHQSSDWVKITELLLGKAPANFKFKPRHKSNAWGEGIVSSSTNG